MFDLELGHWKVLWVPCRQARTHTDGGRRDQAVGLRQRDPLAGEVSAPVPGASALGPPERREVQAAQQAHGGVPLVLAYAPHHLLHVYGADPGNLFCLLQAAQSLGRIPSAQGVHEDGGVEQKWQRLVIRRDRRAQPGGQTPVGGAGRQER